MMDKELRRVLVSLLVLASSCALIYGIVELPVAYDAITGRVTTWTQVNIVQTLPANCSLSLPQGWNLVSFYCLQGNVPLGQAFASIAGQKRYVFTYTPLSNNSWQVNTTRVANTSTDYPFYAVDDLSTISREKGMWIYMTSAGTFTFEGSLRETVSIALSPGWNLVGYPTNLSRNITLALTSIAGSYSEVQAYNASSSTWLVYRPDSSNNTLQYMEPYYGYWINATAAATWEVDW